MDLTDVTDQELRAELDARQKARDAERREAFRAAHPCPECGADPQSFETNMVEEHRFAPRDHEGRPMLWAPYEMGTTEGATYEMALTCVNGHVTYDREIKWFEKPISGPPLLSRRGAR